MTIYTGTTAINTTDIVMNNSTSRGRIHLFRQRCDICLSRVLEELCSLHLSADFRSCFSSLALSQA
jgi:hypothetical protein